jgi:glycosyltransferase involved in cell wall biosynthesis
MNRKKKLLFIIPSLEGGGSEKVLSIILKYLSINKFDIALAVVCKEGLYYNEIPSAIEKINLQASRNRNSLIKVYRIINKIKPDIVVTFNVNHTNLIVFIASFFLPSTIKYVVREATTVSVFLKTYKKWKYFLKYFYKAIFKKMDLIICQSAYMRDDLIDNFNVLPEKTIIINNPLEINKISNLVENVKLFSGGYNVIAIGRFVHIKGFDLLIQAFSKIKEPLIHLTIIGQESPEELFYKKELIELVRKHKMEDRITFLPFDPNPFKYMAQANLLVLSSRFEGFPNVAIEANSLGIPVIAFRSPGGISDIIYEGINGLLIENGNIDGLAIAIEKSYLAKWNRTEIMNTAKKYDISFIIPAYESIFDNLVK